MIQINLTPEIQIADQVTGPVTDRNDMMVCLLLAATSALKAIPVAN